MYSFPSLSEHTMAKLFGLGRHATKRVKPSTPIWRMHIFFKCIIYGVAVHCLHMPIYYQKPYQWIILYIEQGCKLLNVVFWVAMSWNPTDGNQQFISIHCYHHPKMEAGHHSPKYYHLQDNTASQPKRPQLRFTSVREDLKLQIGIYNGPK